ncbi:DUF2946 family protein [Cognatilysobacter segetis]|uniref:DUF2946 family protein n=1 Tax=Cognatilysobacter segetis TaxID=2492394 RepID=UPI00105C1192|nr:DUF2946 family protein [Lysobacter segetis]
MRFRSLHRRFAALALLAMLLLVTMPTLTSQRAMGPAVVVSPADPHATASAPPSPARIELRVQAHRPHGEAPHRAPHEGHDGGACAYCPLLAGLLERVAPAPVATSPRPTVPLRRNVAVARTLGWRDTLGARGPPPRVRA